MSLLSQAFWLGVAVLVALSFTWWKRQVGRRAALLARMAHLEEKLDATTAAGRRLALQMSRLEKLLVQKGLLDPEDIDEGAEPQRSERRSSTELH